MNTEDYTQIQLVEAALDNPGLMKEGAGGYGYY